MKKKHIVRDTKKRSILKALTGRALEVTIGTFIISIFILNNLEQSLVVAILSECLCTATSYINDRIWNLSQFGREVECS